MYIGKEFKVLSLLILRTTFLSANAQNVQVSNFFETISLEGMWFLYLDALKSGDCKAC